MILAIQYNIYIILKVFFFLFNPSQFQRSAKLVNIIEQVSVTTYISYYNALYR